MILHISFCIVLVHDPKDMLGINDNTKYLNAAAVSELINVLLNRPNHGMFDFSQNIMAFYSCLRFEVQNEVNVSNYPDYK